MDEIVRKYLSGLAIGEPQRHRNMSVFPLSTSIDGGPDYTTLKDALEKALLGVTEVSSGGSVPELKVINTADIAVLLLDGEELAGAKQNRVLNTTILVKEKSETVIPVSCTEQGRWSYVSKSFRDSDTVMSPRLRVEKAKTVSTSLSSTGQYRSDQGTVWRSINEMAAKAGTVSETGAMKDTFVQKTAELEEYIKAFPYVRSQKGLLVFIAGEAVGFDFVSREKAFELLHPKLIKSYAMEAVLEDKKDGAKPDRDRARRSTRRRQTARRRNTNRWDGATISVTRARRSSGRRSPSTTRWFISPFSGSARPIRAATWPGPGTASNSGYDPGGASPKRHSNTEGLKKGYSRRDIR